MLSPTNRQLIADTFGLLVVDQNARPDGMVHIAEEGLNRLLDAARAQPAPLDEGAAGEPHELIERLLDAQQDINLAANETMRQSLADASALIDEIEPILRQALAGHPSPPPAAEGGRLEPDDPTEEMIQAALEVDFDNEDERGAVINLWHVMKAAAPPAADDALRVAVEELETEREWHDLRADLALDEARECSHRDETSAEMSAMCAYNRHSRRVEALDKALAALKAGGVK